MSNFRINTYFWSFRIQAWKISFSNMRSKMLLQQQKLFFPLWGQMWEEKYSHKKLVLKEAEALEGLQTILVKFSHRWITTLSDILCEWNEDTRAILVMSYIMPDIELRSLIFLLGRGVIKTLKFPFAELLKPKLWWQRTKSLLVAFGLIFGWFGHNTDDISP